MTVDFQEHFWGDKQNGFDILYQNLKCGSSAAKELADFLKSRAFIEETNVNALVKLSRKTNNQPLGTFNPLWIILKSSTEKLSSLHTQTGQRLNQLIKEVTKYCDEHHKKQKQIKTEETSTIEANNELRETLAALNKAKEFYYSKTVEIERLKRESSSQKDIEKAEGRSNKAYTEYKNLVEKYRKSKDDYEKKFRLSCKSFQKLEEEHLKQMKDYMASYFQILESGHTLIGQVYKEFQNNCREMTTERLLELFIKSKGTGSVKTDVQLEEASLNNFQMNTSNLSTSTLGSKSTLNYPSSSDLINLDLMPQSSIPAYVSATNDFTVPLDSNLMNASQFTSSTNNLRKEGPNKGQFVDSYANYNMSFDRNYMMDVNVLARQSQTFKGKENTVSNNPKATLNDAQKDHHKSFPDIRANNTNNRASKWFLRNKKEKLKEKKGRNKKDSDDESNTGSFTGSKSDLQEASPNNNNNNDFMVDAEGYTIRPMQAQKEDDNFYSSSDSASDSEEEKEKKIYVKINPLNKNGAQISASVDQLIASAGALQLAPTNQTSRRANLSANPSPVNLDGIIKRSVSATQTSFKTKQDDLFDIFSGQTNGNSKTTGTIDGRNNANSFATSFDPLANSKKTDAVTKESAPAPGNSTSDRYAAFSDLFVMPSSSASASNEAAPDLKPPSTTLAETNVLPLPPRATNVDTSFNSYSVSNSSLLSKSVSSTSIMGTTPLSVYKPLSKSFGSSSIASNGISMSRADSFSSLSSEFRMTPISLCSSRDASPLTIGMSDTVPIAIAFQESIGACFKGTDENLCKINIIGCIKIAFSAGIIQSFSSNPYLQPLTFRLKNINKLDRIILSKDLVTEIDSSEQISTYEMNTATLQSSLRRLYEQSPNARYYNLDIFKYQLCTLPGAKNAPLQLVSYWKCEENCTNLKIDFKYNATAFSNHSIQPLRNIQFTANVDGNVTSMNSQPEGKWDSLTKQAIWKYNEISQATDNAGLGSIKAKFDLANGPTCPSSVYVQFSSPDTTLSGLEFELTGPGYRLSLVKRQISSGRYYCEPKV